MKSLFQTSYMKVVFYGLLTLLTFCVYVDVLRPGISVYIDPNNGQHIRTYRYGLEEGDPDETNMSDNYIINLRPNPVIINSDNILEPNQVILSGDTSTDQSYHSSDNQHTTRDPMNSFNQQTYPNINHPINPNEQKGSNIDLNEQTGSNTNLNEHTGLNIDQNKQTDPNINPYTLLNKSDSFLKTNIDSFENELDIQRSTHWITQSSDHFHLYVYNVHWDNRIDLHTRPVLRILALLTTGHREKVSDFSGACFITCGDNTPVIQVPYNQTDSKPIYNPSFINNIPYYPYVFVCQLMSSPCHQPTRAIVLVEPPGGYIVAPITLNITNSLSVHYSTEIDTEDMIDVGGCGPVIFGHINPYRLVEWLEMMKILGVGKLMLYKHLIDEGILNILEVYQQQGFVQLVEFFDDVFPVMNEDFRADIYMLATIALTDCMYRTMYQYKWMIVVDLDELILPIKHLTYNNLLNQLNQTIDYSSHNKHVGFKFIHTDFILDPVLDPQKDESIPWQLTMMQHRRRLPVMQNIYHPKSIINPRYCTAMHFHVCRGYIPGVKLAHPVSTSVALDCHYRSHLCPPGAKRFKQCLTALSTGKPTRDNIILKYLPALTKTIRPQLDILGLAPLEDRNSYD